jgi:hypothetical protein
MNTGYSSIQDARPPELRYEGAKLNINLRILHLRYQKILRNLLEGMAVKGAVLLSPPRKICIADVHTRVGQALSKANRI